MRLLRAVVIVVVLVLAVYLGYRVASHRAATPPGVVVYYCTTDGETLGRFTVSINPNAADAASRAFYATVQAVAGPPPGVTAIRFPQGTAVRSVRVTDGTATVDLGGAITTPQSGSLGESGEFKGLVWTLTSLPGISSVRVDVDGAAVSTLPGGHFELDEPLTRQSW